VPNNAAVDGPEKIAQQSFSQSGPKWFDHIDTLPRF
jgi:hypothetical protein